MEVRKVKSLVILLVGLLVGAAVGFGASEIIRPLYQGSNVMTFKTTLSLTPVGAESVVHGETVNLTASLNASFPVQMVLEIGGKYLYQEKSIELQAKMAGSTYWSIIDTEKTVYNDSCGQVYFNYTLTTAGNYSLKAVFAGTDLLVSSESSICTITAT